MTLFNRFFCCFCFFLSNFLYAQEDIYSLSSSKNYANYLYQNHDYELAIQEYERIVYLDSLDENAKIRLIQSYRFLKKYQIALMKLNDWKSQDPLFLEEKIKLLLLKKQFPQATVFLEKQAKFPQEKLIFYQVATSMLAYDIEKANQLLQKDSLNQTVLFQEYRTIIADIQGFNKKRVGLALPMSIIVPGTGKMYVGYWKDGFFSLLLTSMSAWQAYRAFDQRGIKSAYGWIYTGLATGFYIGNLYGTVKAVRKFNSNFQHKNIHRIEKITFSTF